MEKNELTKEDCLKIFQGIFKVTLSDEEIERYLIEFGKNALTALATHGKNNIGFTPIFLQRFISKVINLRGSIHETRYKRIREEILPASTFALMLSKLGFGKYLIVASDAPDIALVSWNGDLKAKVRKPLAIPIEMTMIPNRPDIKDASESLEEGIVNAIIEKKFMMRYPPETILLVSLGFIEDINYQVIASRMKNRGSVPYHQIWILNEVNVGIVEASCVYPLSEYQYHKFDLVRDLLPSLY